jgi:ADP-heptose:LPS heptosyltransferase
MSDSFSSPGSERVLVFHRGALGDVLLSLPFLAALPSHFGVRGLTLVGRGSVMELLAGQPFVAGVLDQDRAVWSGLYGEKAEVSARLEGVLRDHRAAVVFTRRAVDPLLAGLQRLGLARVMAVPSRQPAGAEVHLVDHMFSATGVAPFSTRIELELPAQAVEQAKAFLQAQGLEPGRWVSLHPGSGGARKIWPFDSWLALAARLEREVGLPPLFILGPAEAGLRQKVSAGLGAERVRLAENLPLPVLAACLALGRAHIGPDSGITHLAAVLGRPTVALFGPTSPACWAPRGPAVTVLAPPGGPDAFTDWAWLTPERVLSVLLEAMA